MLISQKNGRTHGTSKRVTIALSCYKADNYIDGYIDCLKSQENIDEIQLVVFDYPYSHANPQQVKETIHQLEKTTLLYMDRGTIKEDLYTAWNQIFSLSNTDYIANLNVDDRVSQDYFNLAVKTLDSLNLDVFSTNAIALSIAGDLSTEIYRLRHFKEHEYNESMVKIYGLKEFAQVHGGYFKKSNPPHCVPVWRLGWHKRIGDFNPSKFDWCSDYEYWLRMASAGAKFGVHNSFKTYFLSATGTASDRLYLQDNQSVIEAWKISFPLAGYKETSLGKNHDLMHHCFNLHTYFSSREYFYIQKDLVSIVVLYHKIDNYLAECIKSIQSQDYPLFECVLVFDNDPESKIQHYCRSLIGDDLRFRFVSLGQKCERNYARNVGIELAIGDYITIVDGDDLLPRDSLSKRLNYVSTLASESKKIVFGGFRCFGQDGDEFICRGRPSYTVETLRLDVIHHGGILFPANLLKKSRYCTNTSDLLLPSFKMSGEDVEFLISFLKENSGYEYINCNSISYNYRHLIGSSNDKRCWPVFKVLNILIKHYGLPKETDQDYKVSFARRLLEFCLWADYSKHRGEEIPKLPFSEAQEKSLLRCLNRSQKESVFKKFTNVLQKQVKDNNDSYLCRVADLHKALIEGDQLQQTTDSIKPSLPLSHPLQSQNQHLSYLVGPYSREQKAHIDETAIIAELTSLKPSGAVMIDVGAHIGTALAAFLDRNWKIFAFEPDNNNRAKLLEFLNNHKGKESVTIDTRCVSNKSQQNIPFYRSEQSTGISGLSAFHESHIEAQRVDTITLKDFFQDKSLPKIDFLKIDTEGNDLFVLQGFPWERCKPSIIECEFEDIKTVPLGYTFHDLARFLVEKGYTVYVSEWHPIIRYGIRHDWNGIRLYPCELADTKGWGNLLAFLDPIDEKALIDAVTKVLKLNPEKQSKPMAGLVSESLNMPNISSTISIRFHELSCSSYFTALSEKTWRYTHPGKDVPENLWIVAFDIFDSTLDRGYISGIRLMSNKKMTIRVTLGRQGNTEWEGSIQKVHLLPHIAQSVQVHHKFVKQHWEVKLQVEVLEVEDGNIADLTFDDIYVHESLDSLRQRLSENEINLSVANRRFREGDYETAMGIYLLLHQKHPLPFDLYFQNAMMAAQKLGIDSVKTIDELMKRVSFQI